MSSLLGERVRQGAALLRDWAVPGEALAQFTHFVTSLCNARCAHCFYPINARKSELTLAEIEKFAGTLPRIRFLLISGGEPFLRQDLPDIIRIYFEKCRFLTVSIPTNGFSADQIGRAVERICSISPALSLGLTVSLDGFSEFHDRVRAVPGLFARALGVLDTVRKQAGALPNLTVSVTTTFMRDNQRELEAFCEFIHREHRPHLHTLNLIRGEAYDPALKDNLDLDLYEKLSERLGNLYPPEDAQSGWRGARTRARRAINRRRYEYIARQARGGGFEGFCLAGEREFVMTEDGDLHGCELISKKLGNVREAGYDFGRIRASLETRSFVAEKRDTQCRCTHECNTRTMLLFDKANALPVLAAMAGFGRAPRNPVGGLPANASGDPTLTR